MSKPCPDCGEEMLPLDMSCQHANHVCPSCVPTFVFEQMKEHDMV